MPRTTKQTSFLIYPALTKFVISDITTLEKQAAVGIFIGPEGGWSDFEVDLVRQREFKVVSLGKTTLRAETAAVIASYLACL